MPKLRTIFAPALFALAIIATPVALAPSAYAGTCEGKVRGLSNTYNAATGSGFLAVRKRPTTRSRQVGELFNGDVVTVWSRSGRWYEVDNGWVHGRYLRVRDCDF